MTVVNLALLLGGSREKMIVVRYINLTQEPSVRASLVAQWLGVCLPMQGTWVRALVREDPTCRAATKPMCHNY